jgi:hypothetical protein
VVQTGSKMTVSSSLTLRQLTEQSQFHAKSVENEVLTFDLATQEKIPAVNYFMEAPTPTVEKHSKYQFQQRETRN